MKINTEYSIDGGWIAVFDNYDGTPIDNETPSDDPIGIGSTEKEAIDDLMDHRNAWRGIATNFTSDKNKPTDESKAIFNALNKANCYQDIFDAFMGINSTPLMEFENMIDVILELRDKKTVRGIGKKL